MLKKILLFFVFWTLSISAFELDPVDDGSEPPRPPGFASQLDVARSLASGNNYFAHISNLTNDLILENPSMDFASLHVVLVFPNGEQAIKYLKLNSRETKIIELNQMEGAHEAFVVSLQRFKLSINQRTRSGQSHENPVKVNSPSMVDLDFRKVSAADGTIITVGIDSQDRVHYTVFGRIIGTWDHGTYEVIQNDGSVLHQPAK